MYDYFVSLLQCKAEILAGIFAALAIHSYFYRLRLDKEATLYILKRRVKELKRFKYITMSDDKFEYIQAIFDRMEKYMGDRFDRMEATQNKQGERIDALEARIYKIEKSTAITRREIAIYVTLAVTIITVILEKLNVL